MNKNDRIPYVCGPLTELSSHAQKRVKTFYERIADVCEEILGVRAFVPHEHYDPVHHPNPLPSEVDAFERRQVCELTSHLIVVPIAPSWGGGIEVEMAYRSGVPIILLCGNERLRQRRISRLLRGNPGLYAEIPYSDEENALSRLASVLRHV